MATIKVNENYRINFDGTQFTVERWCPAEEITFGKLKGTMSTEKWKCCGKFFTRIDSAVKHIADQSVLSQDYESLGEFLSEYSAMVKRIEDACNV